MLPPSFDSPIVSCLVKYNIPLSSSSMNRSLMVINLSVGTVNTRSKSAICSNRSFGTRAIDPFREGGFLYASILSRRSRTGRGAISCYGIKVGWNRARLDFLKYRGPSIALNELPVTSRENRQNPQLTAKRYLMR
jgi:hypothetical protein